MQHYQVRKTFTTTWITGLTFLAGAINVSSIFLLDKTISHHTGSLSKAAIALVNLDIKSTYDLLSYVLLFFIGSFISGYTTYQRNRGVRLLHSFYPLLFGIGLIASHYAKVDLEDVLRMMAFGMGLQNGTRIRFHAIVIRTTHMTGYLTDAAVSFGRSFRGNKEARFEALFLSYSILIFFVGGLFGAFLQIHFNSYSQVILGSLYLLISGLVFVFHPKSI
jgi:uncharacterized membrane protein YoaK (UPF0700 family)